VPRLRLTGAEWLRRGFPPLLGWLLLLATPFALSGVIRTITGLGIAAALAVALLVTTACAILVFRTVPPRRADRARDLAVTGALIVLAVLAAVALYNRHFGGAVVLANSGIPDAGNHVLQQHDFVERSPDGYFGFVSQYAFVEWLKRLLRLDDFWGFLVASYAGVVVYALAGLAAAATALERFRTTERRAYWIGFAAACATSLVLLAVALPFLHYHHSEGFFPPLFGILPLVALWLTDGLTRVRWLRLSASLFVLAVYRYTYGLNLPDVMVALAVIALIEAAGAGERLVRWGAVAVALALGFGAFKAARLLATGFHREGPFQPYDVGVVVGAEWGFVAALVAATWLPGARSLLAGSGVARWMRLPILLGLINALFMTLVAKPPSGQDYYYLKTNLHAFVLLLSATVVAAAALSSGWAVRGRVHGVEARLVARALVPMVALALATFFLGRGLAVYWPSFRERAFGAPPYHQLQPLVDLHAWRRIRRTLDEKHARFGGYLTSYYPVFNFMNASFDYWNGGIRFFYGNPPALQPGYCVFWEGGTPQQRLEPDFPQRWRAEELSRDERRTCVGYQAPWNPAMNRTLCWICP
jgi:hypothetical protein